MPTIHEEAGFRFGFVMADGRERPHVHITGHGGTMKVWLDTLEIAYDRGLPAQARRKALQIVGEQQASMMLVWKETFGK